MRLETAEEEKKRLARKERKRLAQELRQIAYHGVNQPANVAVFQDSFKVAVFITILEHLVEIPEIADFVEASFTTIRAALVKHPDDAPGLTLADLEALVGSIPLPTWPQQPS